MGERERRVKVCVFEREKVGVHEREERERSWRVYVCEGEMKIEKGLKSA